MLTSFFLMELERDQVKVWHVPEGVRGKKGIKCGVSHKVRYPKLIVAL
jgi:hypothetical protein